MENLARAVVQAFAFLDLSDDDAIDPDAAVKAMEDLTSYLRNCTPEERQALKNAAAWHLKAENSSKNPRKIVIKFYKTFTKDLFD